MGETTGISWTDSTFNPWWGCVEVSPACDNCYAREVAARFSPGFWGKEAPRRFFGEKHWNDLFRWEKAAVKAGVKRKVFCASMADLFEDRRDLDVWRSKLFEIIMKTPNLIYQLLTKRADRILGLVPSEWNEKGWPSNVWMGVTAENQRRWEERVPLLKGTGAKVKWVSAEPLLSDIVDDYKGVDWVVVGGESGSSRMMESSWVNNVLVRCTSAGTKFFFKQKGDMLSAKMGCKNKAGKDPSEWPLWMRVQEFPEAA